jgi:hypothetical protein
MNDASRAEPTVVDMRAGLTADVLADLHLARELYLARKSETVGIFGFWINRPDQAPRLIVLLLENRDIPTASTASPASSFEEPITVKLKESDTAWERALRLIQPGDVLDLRWTGSRAVLVVHPPAPPISFSFMRPDRRHPGDPEIHLSVTFYSDAPQQPADG